MFLFLPSLSAYVLQAGWLRGSNLTPKKKKKLKKRIGQTLCKNTVVPVHLISAHLESPIIKLSIYNPRVILSSLDGIVSPLTSSNESIQKQSLLKWNARTRLTECNIKFSPWPVAAKRNSNFSGKNHVCHLVQQCVAA